MNTNLKTSEETFHRGDILYSLCKNSLSFYIFDEYISDTEAKVSCVLSDYPVRMMKSTDKDRIILILRDDVHHITQGCNLYTVFLSWCNDLGYEWNAFDKKLNRISTLEDGQIMQYSSDMYAVIRRKVSNGENGSPAFDYYFILAYDRNLKKYVIIRNPYEKSVEDWEPVRDDEDIEVFQKLLHKAGYVWNSDKKVLIKI